MAEIRQKDSTNNTIEIFIRSAVTTPVGQARTGLVFDTAGLVISYTRDNAATVQITLATLSTITSSWATGGFKEASSSLSPGLYRLDVPNLAFVSGTGVNKVRITWTGANVIDDGVEIDLITYDPTTVDKTGFALSTAGVNAVRDSVISDATPFAGASIATLISRVTGAVALASDWTSTRAGRLDVAVSSRSSHTAADVWANSTRTLSAQSDSSGVTTLLGRVSGNLPLATDYTSTRAAKLDQLDVLLSTRLATTGYTAPDNTSVTAIKAKTDNLPAAPAAVSNIPTASENAIAGFAGGNIDGLTFIEWLRLVGAVNFANALGLKTTTPAIKSINGALKTRLNVVLDLITGDRTITISDKT